MGLQLTAARTSNTRRSLTLGTLHSQTTSCSWKRLRGYRKQKLQGRKTQFKDMTTRSLIRIELKPQAGKVVSTGTGLSKRMRQLSLSLVSEVPERPRESLGQRSILQACRSLRAKTTTRLALSCRSETWKTATAKKASKAQTNLILESLMGAMPQKIVWSAWILKGADIWVRHLCSHVHTEPPVDTRSIARARPRDMLGAGREGVQCMQAYLVAIYCRP